MHYLEAETTILSKTPFFIFQIAPLNEFGVYLLTEYYSQFTSEVASAEE
jgi:hypothetical protein